MILKAMVKKKCLNPKLHRSRVAENPLPGNTEGRAPFGWLALCLVVVLLSCEDPTFCSLGWLGMEFWWDLVHHPS